MGLRAVGIARFSSRASCVCSADSLATRTCPALLSSFQPRQRRRAQESGKDAAKMIYRNWSLLSSTVVIWGSVATAGLAGIFLLGGKEKFNDYLCCEGERLRQQDRAARIRN
ncbi:succinate dehydrogenase subunit 8A, mitochondrial-like [Phragmites australis]|uniref:succinate dehydrogenase subunit 8A, mitochondrial-like n=1 Tax=Phragmites australis TaxID=29695 RepID=UPI002D78CFF4|nr:succinate dehydrogenase subunit 8A, mitochondrial-like [Phragmites australis]